MKIHVVLILAIFAISCDTSVLESKLSELDNVIKHRDLYTEQYYQRIVELEEKLKETSDIDAQWYSAYEIYGLFSKSQVDSSIVYLNLMEELSGDSFDHKVKTAFARAEIMIASRDYSNASYLLSSLDTLRMNNEQKSHFYDVTLLLYSMQVNEDSIPETQREMLRSLRHNLRKKYISCPGIDEFEKIRRPAIQMYEEGNIKAAIPILENLVDTAPHDKKAHASYSLAKAYQANNDTERAKYWFAQAAIYNLKEPSGEHLSLYELSIILFEEHSLSRALSYSQAALKEALACSYNARIINSANSQLSIVRAAEYQERRIQTFWKIVILCLCIFLVTILLFWIKTLSQSKKIHDNAKEIGRMNRLLEEAGKIKEGYVFRYINLSASYLRMFEDYRHDLRVTLKEGGEEALREKIRMPETELQAINQKQFYSIFDETFMGIFPDFVSKVNSLLKEDARFSIRRNETMPTGLRILAAIRLGITDSGRIAEFLNCAISSVYTHRCKIKRAAICPPDEFEKRIATL